jgi:hypothetical protein
MQKRCALQDALLLLHFEKMQRSREQRTSKERGEAKQQARISPPRPGARRECGSGRKSGGRAEAIPPALLPT